MKLSLDDLVNTYNIDTAAEHFKRLEFLEKLAGHVKLGDASVLELGSALGQLTELLADRSRRVVAVDGSSRFLEIAKARPGNRRVQFVHSLFEDLSLVDQFDVIVMHHVLEHIEDPLTILKKLHALLSPRGLLAISVPNAHALSRQLAVKMDLMKSVYDLTENDLRHGHYRVYDSQSLDGDVRAAGYDTVSTHGLSFKLFADFQNEQMVKAGILGDRQFKGLWKLAEEHQAVSGVIMVIARPAHRASSM
jgi:SAM-dependent methyltransferase